MHRRIAASVIDYVGQGRASFNTLPFFDLHRAIKAVGTEQRGAVFNDDESTVPAQTGPGIDNLAVVRRAHHSCPPL